MASLPRGGALGTVHVWLADAMQISDLDQPCTDNVSANEVISIYVCTHLDGWP